MSHDSFHIQVPSPDAIEAAVAGTQTTSATSGTDQGDGQLGILRTYETSAASAAGGHSRSASSGGGYGAASSGDGHGGQQGGHQLERLSAHDRKLDVVMAGHRGDAATAEMYLADSEASVRAAALSALARCESLRGSHLQQAMADAAPQVRARAAELAPADIDIVCMLRDPDATVVESAAAALGERDSDPSSVTELCRVALNHEELLCRESAIASIGSISAGLDAVLHFGIDGATTDGAPSGLDERFETWDLANGPRLLTNDSQALPPTEEAAIRDALAESVETLLAAMGDRAPVRRRAVLGLYVFEDAVAQKAVRDALGDADSQVRAMAGDLLNTYAD